MISLEKCQCDEQSASKFVAAVAGSPPFQCSERVENSYIFDGFILDLFGKQLQDEIRGRVGHDWTDNLLINWQFHNNLADLDGSLMLSLHRSSYFFF